jgi:hypothetical protein
VIRGLRRALVLLALAGCSAPRGEDPRPASPAPAISWEGGTALTSNDGAWRIVYEFEKAPIPRGQPFALDVWVFSSDAPDLPRTDVALSVDAAMPEHGHGMNRVPRIEAKGGGRFRAEGLLFHMPGRWELYFDVTRGPITERAQTDVVLE